ncbi:hypothetical protein VT84_10385 [Gemmata sp. SH-PL17]|uniref:hypothetical protein n=1 Tax=Gemmata sp. SH-PL17 TaxID=1630693 RepID=UPI00078D20F9|nr:hypothetical protein [Gemmata sp. SH-PL17]AMV24794.1 hypothetical protein VT84_10385 [Gemmata sp. SH-PL17]
MLKLLKAVSRRSWMVLGLIVYLIAVVAGGWWWFGQSTVDTRFVGTWHIQSEVTPPEIVVEMGLHADGTMHMRVRNRETGAVLSDHPFGRWRVAGDRFHEIHATPADTDPSLRRFFTRKKARVLEYTMTWDGPDQFRLEGPALVSPFVTWTRIESPHSP